MRLDEVIGVDISQKGEVLDHKHDKSCPRATIVTFIVLRDEGNALILERFLTIRRVELLDFRDDLVV